MDELCRYVRVPCVLLRMLVVSLAVGAVSYYNGDGIWRAVGFGLASLLLIQLGYFAVVIIIIASQKRRRD